MRMVQIRNVPDELHGTLKARAALAGMTLSDYLLAELRRVAERPTRAELLERLRRLPPVQPSVPAALVIREARERR